MFTTYHYVDTDLTQHIVCFDNDKLWDYHVAYIINVYLLKYVGAHINEEKVRDITREKLGK